MKKIVPHDTMIEEGGGVIGWSADAYSIEDIEEEWDYLFEDRPARTLLVTTYYAARWTTKAELANPDLLYDMFGDYEQAGYDTSVYYWRVTADWKPKNQHSQGPFMYWEIR
jgi:hypothetical protein